MARRAAALVLAAALALSGCSLRGLGGCGGAGGYERGADMSTQEVSQRDVEVARRLGAPDDVVGALEGGRWPSQNSMSYVRSAEAAEDYLALRYGLRFEATRVIVDESLFVPGQSYATCRAAEGPFAGEDVKVSWWPGRSGDKGWEDNYLYVSLHGEWEARVRSLVEPLMEGQPEGTMVCKALMYDSTIPTTVRGTTLDEVQTNVGGFVSIYISEDSPLTEDELSELHDRVVATMQPTGMRIDVITRKVTDLQDGQPFTEDFAYYAKSFIWMRETDLNYGGE